VKILTRSRKAAKEIQYYSFFAPSRLCVEGFDVTS
jgi:hypothetical protein